MKKVFFTILVAFALVLTISSCRDDFNDYDTEQIDNDEVKEDDI